MSEPDETDPRRQMDSQSLEEGFVREGQEFLQDRTRFLIRVGAPVYLAFWLLDLLVASPFAIEFLLLRLAATAVFVLTYNLTTSKIGRRWSVVLSVSFIYIAALEIVIMTAFLGGFVSSYYLGIMLVCFVAGFYMPWKLPVTLVFCLLTLATYFGVNLAVHGGKSLAGVAEPVFFLGTTCFFACLATVANEKRRRRDLTLRLHLEKANEGLKELDEAKTRLFANVSHELRTPLMMILGPLEKLISCESDPAQHRLLETMLANGRRLLRHVNTLLEMARLEAGRPNLRLGSGNLGRLVAEFVESSEPYATARDVQLKTAGLSQVRDSVFDHEKVEVIVANLLSNAIKFTPAGGSVSIVAGESGDRVYARVADTGPGIPRDQQAQIFERFYHVDTLTAHGQEGAGLGLALSRELVQLHGGSLKLTSEPGSGCVFTFDLPRQPVMPQERRRGYRRREDRMAAARVDSLAASEHDFQKRVKTLFSDITPSLLPKEKPAFQPGICTQLPRVLVLEDNDDFRRFVAQELAEDYHVETAANGVEGWEALQRARPHLIVADIMMPRMDGHAFCRKLRADPFFFAVPVVLVTAKTGCEAVVEGLAAGADDYVTKPFDIRELKARISAHIRARQLEKKLDERESRLVAIGEMVSVIVHDLRNPLTNMLAFTELARNDALEGEERSEIAEDLESLAKEARRLQQMLAETLDFARAGSLPMKIESTPVCAFLCEVLEEQRRDLRRSEIELIVDLDLDKALEIPLDRPKIHRVIENLVANARDALNYSACGGKGHRVWFRAGADDETLILRVADNGPGISQDMVQRVFEPFASAGAKRGIGLGLVTVRNLIKAHNGNISVEPKAPEGGAAFTFTLPRKPQSC